MTGTIIEQISEFAFSSSFETLPDFVVQECRRLALDSIGCALAATDHPKGRAGIEYGRILSGGSDQATIIGTEFRGSMFGAAFANGELINALDMDAIVPPGHVTAYALPAILSAAETFGSSGKDVIRAIAVSHELGNRFGKAIDGLRDTENGKLTSPPVMGFSTAIFGATAAISLLKGHSAATMAHALGIAGTILPVNAQGAWFKHAPSTTIKYLLTGALTQSAFTAAYMAELGHRGDLMVVDDREFGLARYIGTKRWEPEHIVRGLGSKWLFPGQQSYKPYPHCRLFNGVLDCVIKICQDHDIKPDEIESVRAYVEAIADQPVWTNRKIDHVVDAQFSMAHGISVAAHRVPPGKDWQTPDLVFSESVMRLMGKITTELYPDYVKLLTEHGASRPAKAEIRARGQLFVEERRFPKGSPSPDPESLMTTDELIQKFRHNATAVISDAAADALVDATLRLEAIADFSGIMRLTGTYSQSLGETASRGKESAAA